MFKYAVVFCTVLAAAHATPAVVSSTTEEATRFVLGSSTTTTVYVVDTTTTVTGVTKVCAVPTSVTGPCRRRRVMEEQPILLPVDEVDKVDVIVPSQVDPVEASPAAELRVEEAAASSIEAVATDAQVASSEPVYVDIMGLPKFYDVQERHANEPRALVLRFTTTATITSTSFIPLTVATKTYKISGCIPPEFSTSLC